MSAAGAGFRGTFAPAFGVDRLSGFFLVTLAVIAVPAAVFARDARARHPSRRADNRTDGRLLPGAGRLVTAHDPVT